MKIILKEDHGVLGSAGDVVEVKGGYARNYLIPRGIGKVANESNIKAMSELRKQQHKKIEKEVEDAKNLAGELEKVTLQMTVKTGEDNKVFGSVTSQNLADELHGKGFAAIDKRKILLPHPIREIGEFPVKIKVYGEVMAEIKVIVEKEATDDKVVDKVQEEIDAKKAAEEKAQAVTQEVVEEKVEETPEIVAEDEVIAEEKIEEPVPEDSGEENQEEGKE
ncbi:MAG: 50S ribosomal protein L9 [Ignavibacteriae bacterium]|nr:50S ribosomal protein L9 [Ignavibacteriota bacterium]MCB9242736.1 50S ribosomal protein L9 [Ignavibacteriales bacterium]